MKKTWLNDIIEFSPYPYGPLSPLKYRSSLLYFEKGQRVSSLWCRCTYKYVYTCVNVYVCTTE